MGSNFAITITTLMVTASCTPYITIKVNSHTIMEAPTMDGILFPSPNKGKKFPKAANSRVAKDTWERIALTQ